MYIDAGHLSERFALFVLNALGELVLASTSPEELTVVGANDMLREARFLSAVAANGVPVPTVLAVAQAGEVIDVPFYVMTVVDGPVVTTVTPAPLDTPDAR